MTERLRLAAASDDDGALANVRARIPLDAGTYRLRYATRTGALARVDGQIAGAFDREHDTLLFDVASEGEHEIALDVERRSLPTNHLPARGRVRWHLMLWRARQRPAIVAGLHRVGGGGVAAGSLAKVHPWTFAATLLRALALRASREVRVPRGETRPADAISVVGHSHLDVAWLWPFSAAKRKALRTFAIAVEHLERDAGVVFTQSQAQLYDVVSRGDAALFERVRALVSAGRFDASSACMWVESDANLPSGESLLRQFLHGMRYAREVLGVEPAVAWLPDTFGFPATFPTIAAHVGIRFFATTKLMWNDTTVFPYRRFVWRAADGSELVSALLASYDGALTAARERRARERGELLVLGCGDGGGGLTDAMIARAQAIGAAWTTLGAWMESVAAGRDALAVHADELYLETHRGTLTTHREIKAANAALEGELDLAEELAAWCSAVRLAPGMVRTLNDDLQRAWTIVLRNQFHDIAAGTLTADAFAEVREDYERAGQIVARTQESARSVLPRGLQLPEPEVVAAAADDGAFVLDNGLVRARVRADGSISELGIAGGRNLVTQGNVLAAYVDQPKKWDAWNLDRGYERRRRRVVPESASVEDGGVLVRLRCGRSKIAMRVEVREGEPYVRVELAVAWAERHVLLRVEHWLAIAARHVVFGQPHGTLARTAYPQTDAERAKFEAAGQRYARVEADGAGVALFVRDLYGWSARGLRDGGVHLGTSLLRSPAWPDPACDRGEHRIAYAFVPFLGATTGAIEAAWREYAYPQRVRLFTSDDDGILVVATKPADDGDGVVVRVRECDGRAREVDLRCGGRMRWAGAIDACERPLEEAVEIVEESLRFSIGACALRSFRVRFS